MTKRFALADTLPNPYFTIDAAGGAVTVRTGQTGDGRMMVEIWRGQGQDRQILCRIFAASVTVEPPAEQPDDQPDPAGPGGICVNCRKGFDDCQCSQAGIQAAQDRWNAAHGTS